MNFGDFLTYRALEMFVRMQR